MEMPNVQFWKRQIWEVSSFWTCSVETLLSIWENERWDIPGNENMQGGKEIYPKNISYMAQEIKYGNIELNIISREYGFICKKMQQLWKYRPHINKRAPRAKTQKRPKWRGNMPIFPRNFLAYEEPKKDTLDRITVQIQDLEKGEGYGKI